MNSGDVGDAPLFPQRGNAVISRRIPRASGEKRGSESLEVEELLEELPLFIYLFIYHYLEISTGQG